jgi:rhodanese-related sulfurtransferase
MLLGARARCFSAKIHRTFRTGPREIGEDGKSKRLRSYNHVMSVKNIGPEQAKDILEKDADAVYIDVRTEQEFINGHVPKSVNIPVVSPDPATRQMMPNPDFVKTVSGKFAREKRIIVGCQAGGRSQFAADLLDKDGFQDVSNMQGGFGGARDAMGRVLAPGWTQCGFPVETGA